MLYAFNRPDDEQARPVDREGSRLGVSVGRRVGGAVERNEVKRLVREAFWSIAEDLPADHDYVIVARPDCGELAKRERLEGVSRELTELTSKLGFEAKRAEPAEAAE